MGVSRKYQQERAARGRAANKPVKRERSGRGAKGRTSKLLKEGTAASPTTGRAAEQRRASSAAAKRRAATAGRKPREARKGKQAFGMKKAAPENSGRGTEAKTVAKNKEAKTVAKNKVAKNKVAKTVAKKVAENKVAKTVAENKVATPGPRVGTSGAPGRKKETPTQRYRRQRRRAPGRVR